jgi:hypothetical protein
LRHEEQAMTAPEGNSFFDIFEELHIRVMPLVLQASVFCKVFSIEPILNGMKQIHQQ